MKKAQEKTERRFTIMLQPSLFAQLQQKCAEEYKTPSHLIRDLIIEYVKGSKNQ